ncbi:chromatin assembly factor 1 subunit A-domain-containing protein [Scleroderma yunnanense]
MAQPDVLGSNTTSMSTSVNASPNTNPISEFKNGKVVFRQKPISFEKASETMQEIVKFREMLSNRVRNISGPLTAIPDENKPLIVKLAQESDKTVVALAKQIRSILLPGQGEGDETFRISLESCLPLPVVEHAIKMVMTRINYGLECPSGLKSPASICVWRWEVQDAFKDWLPKSARETAEARTAERVQARTHLSAVFSSLPQAEQDAILDPKCSNKHSAKDTSQVGIPRDLPPVGLEPGEDQKDNAAIPTLVNTSENVLSKGRPKKAVDTEKAAKIKEKEERKAARAEKERKHKDAQEKSRSIMANFFGKAKSDNQMSPSKDPNEAAGPRSVENDFQKTFKPFVLKKDAELAPHNRYLERNKRRSIVQETGATHDDAIVIDEDASIECETATTRARTLLLNESTEGNAPEGLREVLPLLRQRCLVHARRRKIPSFKTYNGRTVRDTLAQLNEAEIAGDPAHVRQLLIALNDRKLFPAKVLIFKEDARPGYYGTWTRNSRIVGPRTPFAQDLLARDYAYDSGEEWEDEDVSQADDVVDDAEDDDADGDEPDSDLDSWLVDDEEMEVPLALDPRDLSPSFIDVPIPSSKRKAEGRDKQLVKKRKVVVPLVPFAKGPCWESVVGQSDYEPFEAYRIQFFNDVPCPIDPFTFTSAAEERQNAKTELVLPDKPLVGPGGATILPAKRAGVTQAPKTPFPEAHVGALLAKITELATPSLPYLVENIYQDLRAHKVKKNSIEAKVREVGEKSKNRVWVVKEAVRVSADIFSAI